VHTPLRHGRLHLLDAAAHFVLRMSAKGVGVVQVIRPASVPVSPATYSAPGAPQNQEDNSHDQQNPADVIEQAYAGDVADDQQDKTENDHIVPFEGELAAAYDSGSSPARSET
jgi:hypothetical protein